MTPAIPFDNSYARLPERFFARVPPTPVRAPRLIRLNRPLAEALGLDSDALAGEEGAAIFAGNALPEGAEPIATAYAGHQFGGFVPQLGDGRAILIGEVVGRDGVRRDIQLKGAGRTPYSRSGDGRAAVGPVIREYLVSEAMAALGVPTTRALAAAFTGEPVYRETVLPGAVLARVAQSHIRVGTFQYFAAREDVEGLRALADHVIARHYPDLAGAEHHYAALLGAVAVRQAQLVARWLGIGFIHGVMNTDNTSIVGETIDYGPCAFMDAYDPATVFSSIDAHGRYAYANQPRIALWNLTRLAEALLPLLGEGEAEQVAAAEDALAVYGPAFNEAYLRELRGKLGLSRAQDDDLALAQGLLTAMVRGGADFTNAFRALCSVAEDPGREDALKALFTDTSALEVWLPLWRARLEAEGGDRAARASAMRAVNPALIPRNHRVEAAIAAIVERGDLGPFEELHAALAKPYEDDPSFAHLTTPPQPEERVLKTFCGT